MIFGLSRYFRSKYFDDFRCALLHLESFSLISSLPQPSLSLSLSLSISLSLSLSLSIVLSLLAFWSILFSWFLSHFCFRMHRVVCGYINGSPKWRVCFLLESHPPSRQQLRQGSQQLSHHTHPRWPRPGTQAQRYTSLFFSSSLSGFLHQRLLQKKKKTSCECCAGTMFFGRGRLTMWRPCSPIAVKNCDMRSIFEHIQFVVKLIWSDIEVACIDRTKRYRNDSMRGQQVYFSVLYAVFIFLHFLGGGYGWYYTNRGFHSCQALTLHVRSRCMFI